MDLKSLHVGIKKIIKKVAKKTKIDRSFRFNLLKKKFRIAHKFAYYYENESLRDNYIFYEASCSDDFNSNPYAIFKYLIDNDKHKDMIHVISLNNLKNKKVKPYRKHPRVKIVKKDSDDYIKYLESCKYIICDNTTTTYHIKKEGQIYVNSWHASLFKTLGRDTDKIWETNNISKNIMCFDYFTSPNKFSSDIFFNAYYCNNLYNGYILEEGYPRNDLYFDCDKDLIRKKLNVQSDKKILLYAPTWRGTTSSKNSNLDIFFEYYDILKEKFGDEYEVLMKLHNMSRKYIKKDQMKKVVSYDLDTMETLSVVDVLITDYSGILFDFLPMEKPIILFQFDKKEYLEQRGGDKEFYLDSSKFPIPTCYNIKKLVNTISNIDSIFQNNELEFKNFIKRYSDHSDGRVCERVVDVVFDNKKSKNMYKLDNLKKQKILIAPRDLKGNGVTESFLALLDNIDYDKYDVSVLLNSHTKYRDKQLRINKNANIFYLSSARQYADKHEFDVVQKYLRTGCTEEIEVLRKFAKRAIRRLFPDVQFDYAIDYNGYSPINALIIGLGVSAGKKAIYLHNDLYQDMKLKNHQLHQVFALYEYFDKLVCVCRESMEANMKDTNNYVKSTYGVDCSDKFTYVINLINGRKIELEAKSDSTIKKNNLEYIKIDAQNEEKSYYLEKPKKSNINFITIGRLSPEKNHKLLIEAFYRCYKKNKKIRLYIIGDGVLYSELEKQISDLKLNGIVYLVGYTIKPFELLSLCDCFILPSLYEGLGLVVLESFVLGKAVISSNIEGPRNFVESYYGVLAEPTEEGLYKAMMKYITDGMKIKKFSYKTFNRKAIDLFYENVLGEKYE